MIRHEQEKPKLIFVGGTGRSGTTILGRLLGRHREIQTSQPIEIKFLASNAGLLDLLYGRRPEASSRRRKFSHRVIRIIPGLDQRILEGKFQERIHGYWWRPDPVPGKSGGLSVLLTEEFRDQALSSFMSVRRREPERAAREFFWQMISPQLIKQPKCWVDTSPPNIFNADRILRLLPEAYFIHMKRDGRRTIDSALKEHWGPTTAMGAVFWWRNRVKESHEALRRIPSSRYLEIQLEELAAFDRENQYRRILDFLQVDDDSTMRDFFETQVKAERVLTNGWQESLSENGVRQKFLEVHRQLQEEGIELPLYE